MRILPSACLLVVSLFVGGCASLLNPTDAPPETPSGPPAAGSTIVYAVVGASDVIGYGSTKVCLPFEDCDGNGYAWVAARQLRSQGFVVNVAQLGVPAAVLSPSFHLLAAQSGVNGVSGNITQAEAPFVRRDATVVTVFAGGNDVNVITGALANDVGASDTNAFIDQKVATFATEFQALITAIRERAPGARIIVMNLPNMARVPYRANSQPLLRQWAQRASVGITTQAINPARDVTVIDLMCDARFYQPSTFSPDGFHPNDTGYGFMAAEIVRAITSASYPAPQASCGFMF